MDYVHSAGRQALSVRQRLAEAQVEAVTVERPLPDVISRHQASLSHILVQGLQMPQLRPEAVSRPSIRAIKSGDIRRGFSTLASWRRF